VENIISAVDVGIINEEFLLNPTSEQRKKSDLVLTIAGTKKDILMIEGLSNFITEQQLLKAIKVGHDEISKLCLVMEEFQGKFGKKKKRDTLRTIPPSLMENIDKVRNNKKNTNKQMCLSSSLLISLICLSFLSFFFLSVIRRENNEYPPSQRETRQT
jgi:polyribonucleotide nucleotidyltransferase